MLRLGRENNFSLLSLISSSLISSSMHEWMMVVVWVKDKNIYNLSKKKIRHSANSFTFKLWVFNTFDP